MLRKITLAVLIAAGTLTGITSNASAQPPIVLQQRQGHGHHHDHDRTRYQVFVRHYGHWDLYRSFRDRDDAYRAAWQLERRGIDAKVERTRGR